MYIYPPSKKAKKTKKRAKEWAKMRMQSDQSIRRETTKCADKSSVFQWWWLLQKLPKSWAQKKSKSQNIDFIFCNLRKLFLKTILFNFNMATILTRT